MAIWPASSVFPLERIPLDWIEVRPPTAANSEGTRSKTAAVRPRNAHIPVCLGRPRCSERTADRLASVAAGGRGGERLLERQEPRATANAADRAAVRGCGPRAGGMGGGAGGRPLLGSRQVAVAR